MEIVGRLTQHASLRTVKKNDRKVVSFTLAVNDYYKPKGEEQGIKVTTYIDCSYWVNPGIQRYLLQGTLVEVQGRIYATAYKDKTGEAKASINCHVNAIKIHKQAALTKQGAESALEEKTDDLPF